MEAVLSLAKEVSALNSTSSFSSSNFDLNRCQISSSDRIYIRWCIMERKYLIEGYVEEINPIIGVDGRFEALVDLSFPLPTPALTLNKLFNHRNKSMIEGMKLRRTKISHGIVFIAIKGPSGRVSHLYEFDKSFLRALIPLKNDKTQRPLHHIKIEGKFCNHCKSFYVLDILQRSHDFLNRNPPSKSSLRKTLTRLLNGQSWYNCKEMITFDCN